MTAPAPDLGNRHEVAVSSYGIRTVTGDVAAVEVGPSLTHEHVLVDLTQYHQPEPDPDVAAELARGVRLETLGTLRRSLVACHDDLVLDDDALAVDELRLLARSGGSLVADVSSHGIRQYRHAPRIRTISQRSGILIVLGTGAYIAPHQPPEIFGRSEEELAALFTTELFDGVADTDVKCGVIGEVGLSTPPTDHEMRVLAAAGTVAHDTGFAVIVHQTDPTGQVALRALDLLRSCGLASNRVAIAHTATWTDFDIFAEVAASGCFLALDTLGLHGSIGPLELPSFRGYLDLVCRLVEAAMAPQLLLSHDVGHKRHLRAYGGVGYDHVFRDVVPELSHRLGPDQVHRLTIENGRRLLARDARVRGT